ncbi:lymphocyte antigen 6G6e-like [Rhynchonycteris naso]
MGPSSAFLCLLSFCGALGLTTAPAQRRLFCYSCSFAKPCYPVPTECQEGEACGVSVGTSEQSETIQRKGCLPKAQCLLPGNATYWSRSYALQHHCCDKDLCNVAAKLQRPPSPLLAALLLAASVPWGGNLLR